MIDGDYQHDEDMPRGKVQADHAMAHLGESDPERCERCGFDPEQPQVLMHVPEKGVQWVTSGTC